MSESISTREFRILTDHLKLLEDEIHSIGEMIHSKPLLIGEKEVVESHFDSFPNLKHSPDACIRTSKELEEMRPKSPDIDSYSDKHKEFLEAQYGYGKKIQETSPFGQSVNTGDSDIKEKPKKLYLKYNTFCPKCGHDLTEE